MGSIAEKGTGSRVSGIINAVLSSSTFGFAPFFSVSLMAAGLSAAEVLTYRWGTATAALALFALIMRRPPLSVTGKQFDRYSGPWNRLPPSLWVQSSSRKNLHCAVSPESFSSLSP